MKRTTINMRFIKKIVSEEKEVEGGKEWDYQFCFIDGDVEKFTTRLIEDVDYIEDMINNSIVDHIDIPPPIDNPPECSQCQSHTNLMCIKNVYYCSLCLYFKMKKEEVK